MWLQGGDQSSTSCRGPPGAQGPGYTCFLCEGSPVTDAVLPLRRFDDILGTGGKACSRSGAAHAPAECHTGEASFLSQAHTGIPDLDLLCPTRRSRHRQPLTPAGLLQEFASIPLRERQKA